MGVTVLIHEYAKSSTPTVDDDGELMLGFYWQFANGDSEEAITGLIGPYNLSMEAEKAAQRAFDRRDY